MDKDTLVLIFQLYSSAIYNYALRLCRDPILADQIVGDVFAKLLDQLSAGNGPTTDLRAYLYRATYHRMIDETRVSKRSAPLETVDWLRHDHSPAYPDVEDQILFKQILHAIRNKLTDDQRHVIVLRFLEEFSLRETAAILGKRVEHVKVIQGRAILALRKTLDHNVTPKAVSSPICRSTSQSIGV